MSNTLSDLIGPLYDDFIIEEEELQKGIEKIKRERSELIDFINFNPNAYIGYTPTFYFLTITFYSHYTSFQRYKLCQDIHKILESEDVRIQESKIEFQYLKVIELHKDKEGNPQPERPHIHILIKCDMFEGLPAVYSNKLLQQLRYKCGRICRLELVRNVENTLLYLIKDQQSLDDVVMSEVYIPPFPDKTKLISLAKCETYKDYLKRLLKIQMDYDELAEHFELYCKEYHPLRAVESFKINPWRFSKGVRRKKKEEEKEDILGLFN